MDSQARLAKRHGTPAQTLQARLRAGEVSREQVRLLAYLGWPVAREASGIDWRNGHKCRAIATLLGDAGEHFRERGWRGGWGTITADPHYVWCPGSLRYKHPDDAAESAHFLTGLQRLTDPLPGVEQWVVCCVPVGKPCRCPTCCDCGARKRTPLRDWLMLHMAIAAARVAHWTREDSCGDPRCMPMSGECCPTHDPERLALDAAATAAREPSAANREACLEAGNAIANGFMQSSQTGFGALALGAYRMGVDGKTGGLRRAVVEFARLTSEQAVLDAIREAGVRVLREAWGL
jgi:hypothetical protein